LAWGNHPNISKAFIEKVMTMCNGVLKTNPNWLMACMYYESAHTFNASKINPSSGAVGLIQFTPLTCTWLYLGITEKEAKKRSLNVRIGYRDIFAAMSEVEQLTWVYKYMSQSQFLGRLNSLEDVYMAIFAPHAVGGAPDDACYTRDRNFVEYDQNKHLDINNNGTITRQEASKPIWDALKEGLLPENVLGTE
jgi:hypothetical protein